MKKLLLGLGILSLAILPIAGMVSCSSDIPQKKEGNITIHEYEAYSEIAGPYFPQGYFISPLLNVNASNVLNEKLSTINVELLQKDFDSVITPLYIINQDKVQTSVKIVENGIKVMSVQSPILGIGGHALLSVSYLEDDSLEVKTKDNIPWLIKGTMSEPIDITELENSLLSTNIELPILQDYFLEKNTGILSKVSAFQDRMKLGELGGLLGYFGNLNQILPALMTTPAPVVGGSEEFFIPSEALDNTFLYPSIIGQLDYTFNKEVLSKMTDKEIILLSTPDDLLKILIPSKRNSDRIIGVKSIDIQPAKIYEKNPLKYKIRILFHNNFFIPEFLTISLDSIKASV